MKTLIIICLAINLFVIQVSKSQEVSTKYGLFIDAGAKYTILEGLGGGVIGLSLDNSAKKLYFNVRRDFIFMITKENIPYTNANNYEITNWHTYDYFDAIYKFTSKVHAGAGFSWIYAGRGKNYYLAFHRDYGYPNFSLNVKYNFDWLRTELRFDLPLEKYEQIKLSPHIFPVSIALYYHFRPKNCK